MRVAAACKARPSRSHLSQRPTLDSKTTVLSQESLMAKYRVRYVHKISPKPDDFGHDIEISDNAFSDNKTLGKALRDAGTLLTGGRIISFRTEGDEVLAFPMVPQLTTYWHCIILKRL
jgi:hypothetical protein